MDSMNLIPYIEDERLYDYAVSCARSLRPDGFADGRADARALRKHRQEIDRCLALLQKRARQETHLPAACEWLLDNHYLLQAVYPDALQALRAAERQRSARGRLLVPELCRALLTAGNGKLTEARCEIFLQGFQSVTVLQRRELLLFPAALQSALVENAAGLCRKLSVSTEPEQLTDSMAALFTSLRRLTGMDMAELLEKADVSAAILAAERDGSFARMDQTTRSRYLQRLEELARREGVEEQELARRLVTQADEESRHVGFLLFSPPPAHRSALYLAALLLMTLPVCLVLTLDLELPLLLLLLPVPVWSIVKGLLDALLLRRVRPSPLPRLDLSAGVPEEGKSVCVLSVLLGCCEIGRLEELYLISRREGKNLRFGLLADLPAAPTQHAPEDESLLADARKAVETLNRKYGGGFYLFTRERSFDGKSWCGTERKRGALLELAKLLCGEPSALQVVGDREALRGTRYILSLDADTRVYPGALGELIGAALHPLNRPVLGSDGVVRAGHGVIHPRIETELASASATDFALIFAGPGGSDPYGGLGSELYMDAFGSGGFAGKGLLDARLLLRCSEGLPAGRILSHDALEGALLRGAYMSDAAFSDAFPATPLVYFKRQHRWIRGDWQNMPWVFCRRFARMDRFRLFDNLMRSLTAPMTMLALLCGLFSASAGLKAAALAALLCLVQSLLLSLTEAVRSRRGRGPRLRRHSRLLTGLGGVLLRCLVRLWLLPYDAWVSFSAIATALWRMCVSRKKLLEWQTFAQTRGGRGLAAHVRAMWPTVVLGVLLMAFSPFVIGKAAGLLWLLSPAAAAALALPAQKARPLSLRDRELLFSSALESFAYFRDLAGPEDHFLPPDNFQQQPPVGAAHRTSPTNIGLYLAAAAALGDRGLIPRQEAKAMLRQTTDTLEAMERHLGHFFNWYDTRTLRPLPPRMISTVDSGNLCAGLITARSALLGWGEEELAGRLSALIGAMDFAPLFDKKRMLFFICYDPEKKAGTGGWYDLMASEAMLTSYLAVARGQVPLRHWQRLSRAQLQKDGYRGLASWSGTMFEYLMPALFLPYDRASLLYESARFCLYVQRRRHAPGKPWGSSESAFYALDAALNYRYKAHGCPELALKRGLETEMVVAPYASFLALAAEPAAALRNLRRLAALGARGRWGYLEALDFTPGRSEQPDGARVACWMAHHLGMSVLAAVNALEEGAVQRLFLADPEMAAYTLLLQERLPEDGRVLRRDGSPVPERPEKVPTALWRLAGREGDAPKASVLSNGVYHLHLTSRGESAAFLGDTCVYRGEDGDPGLVLRVGSGAVEEAVWEMDELRFSRRFLTDGVRCVVTRCCAAGELGELVALSLLSERSVSVPVSILFRPVLAKLRDWADARAYWQLGLEAREQDGKLLLRRLSKAGGKELWLCLAASLPLRFDADRRGGLGPLVTPQVKGELLLRLRPGRTEALTLALCLGATEEEASSAAERLLALCSQEPGNMVHAAAMRLGMPPAEIGQAMELALAVWKAAPLAAAPRRELWRWGLSGDFPLLCCQASARESDSLLRAFCLLKACGVESELVFFSAGQGEYFQPERSRLEKALAAVGLEALLGAEGGIRFVPPEAEEAVQSRAVFSVGGPPLPLVFEEAALLPARGAEAPAFHWKEDGFCYRPSPALPPRIWQHVLTNGSLSAFAADFGPAGLWLANAREMRLLPPPAEITAVRGSERLTAAVGASAVSLFADGASECYVNYSFGLARWEKTIGERRVETLLFLPPEREVRLLLVRGAAELELCWECAPLAGGPDSASLRLEVLGELAAAESPESYLPDTRTLFAVSAPGRWEAEGGTLRCRFTGHQTTVLACGCCSEEELRRSLTPESAEAMLRETEAYWRGLLRRFSVQGLRPAEEHYLNGWAVYQTYACRMLARSSLYQSGGAVGFRDQLQDAVNLLLIDPALARRQILECCRHQYEEGDVMHWWHRHPDGDRGVRTRCSDDLLWLIWALCEYVEATGDLALCAWKEGYRYSAPLRPEERDRYERAAVSPRREPVLEHAHAALACCRRRGFGPHGLPRMGSGDWNDGMDRTGGESVWLGWFLSCCAGRFAALLDRLGDARASEMLDLARTVGLAAESCFSGRWYPRAYREDGRPLGDGERIDSVAQSWAAFCPWALPEHAQAAVDAAIRRLADRQHGLIRLLDPPYGAEDSPGYLSGYGAGFRENGGQYTHAAVWLAMAALRLGRREDGLELLRMLLPENHDPAVFEAEPFVLPADVCAAKGREGIAGWTWYTGSAGWFFRVWTREVLGLELRDGTLRLRPAALEHFRVTWTDFSGRSHIISRQGDAVTVDGAPYLGGAIG